MKKQNLLLILLSAIALAQLTSCKLGFFDKEPEELFIISENFNNVESIDDLDSDYWDYDGEVCIGYDDVYRKWNSYYLKPDTHGNLVKLYFVEDHDDVMQGNFDGSVSNTVSSFTLSHIKPTVDSYLSFDYKTSFLTKYQDVNETIGKVYVDNELVEYLGNFGFSKWRNTGVYLSAGVEHTVRWEVEVPNYTPFQYLYENALYIDNVILLSDNSYQKVTLEPRGEQKTVVNQKLKFNASANWTSTKPTFSVTGGAAIDANGNFTAVNPGTYTVTASLNNLQASTTVVVLDTNYLESKVHYANYTFTGIEKDENGGIKNGSGSFPTELTFIDENTKVETKTPMANIIEFSNPTPTVTTFSADGFMVISGQIKAEIEKGAEFYMVVRKQDPDQSKKDEDKDQPSTFFTLDKNFNERLWFRFGEGVYNVYIAKSHLEEFSLEDGSTGYLSSISSWEEPLFIVTNTSKIPEEEAWFMMPSTIVSIDSLEVANAVNDALYGNTNASNGEKLQLMHDWVMQHFHYDFISLDIYKRKKQDAVTCIRENMAVCEGYSNVYAAMARYCGIPTAVMTEAKYLNHAWNYVFFGNDWRLVDITWDDTAFDPDSTPSNDRAYPNTECYAYFLIPAGGIKSNNYPDGDHNFEDVYAQPRQITVNPMDLTTPPHINGMPDGWY